MTRVALQALYFIILARVLGASEYGAFVGTIALVSFLAPLVGLGTGHILVRDTARDPEAVRPALADALLVTSIVTVVASPTAYALVSTVTPLAISPWLLAMVTLSDVAGAQLTEISAQCFQATRRLRSAALLQIAPVLGRTAAVVGASAYWTAPTLSQWLTAYSVAGLLMCLLGLTITVRAFPPDAPRLSRAIGRVRQGWYFSAMAATQAAHADLDKALMVRLAPIAAAGTYAAAYRLLDVSFAPVRSLMYAAYGRFFQEGARGRAHAVALAIRLFTITGSYSAAAAICIWALAPLLPLVLGHSFDGTVESLRWLVVLLPLRAAQIAAADALVGAGRFGARTLLTFGAVVLNLSLNLVLIPRYSWKGAAIASMLSDGLLAVAFWVLLLRTEPTDPASAPAGGV